VVGLQPDASRNALPARSTAKATREDQIRANQMDLLA
jgi:hypothetical protein